ncbi:MAG: Hsp20/alpha crystallin family protein [Candidatus Anammoxibacter sp.]
MYLVPFKKRDFFADPFDSFEHFGNEISSFFTPISRLMGRDVSLFERDWNPSIDVYESDNEVLVKADIPGLNKDEMDISILDDMLTIKGEKKTENEVSKESYYKSERFCGSFNRTIQLPSEVDEDKVKATYKDGVLELHLPKKEEAKTKHIAIDVK